MGYYTKHIFKIVNEHTVDDLVTLAKLIHEHSGYEFNLYPQLDCVDDRNWNGGDGSKFYEIESAMIAVSRKMSDVEIDVYCHGEDGDRYILHCYNGTVDSEYLGEERDPDDIDSGYVLKEGCKEIDYDMSLGENPEKLDYLN